MYQKENTYWYQIMKTSDIVQVIYVYMNSMSMHSVLSLELLFQLFEELIDIYVAKRQQMWLQNLQYRSHDLHLRP